MITGTPVADKSQRPRSASWNLDEVRTSIATGRGRLRVPRLISLLVAAAVLLAVGLAGPSSTRYGLVLAVALAIVVLGNNAVTATLGEISLNAVAYLAVGAHTSAWLLERRYPLVVAGLGAVVAAALVGAVIAIPMSRLRGLQTALVTFAMAFAVADLTIFATPITGGDQGKYVSTDASVGDLTFAGSDPGMLILVVLLFVLCGALHISLLNSRAGRVALAVGEAPQAAQVFGISATYVRVAIWTWAASLGGLGGFMYALAVGFLSPTQFGVLFGVFLFVGGFVGGTRSAVGALVGGLIVGAVPIWLQDYVPTSATTSAYGVILLVALLAGGRGLAEAVERLGLVLATRLRSRR